MIACIVDSLSRTVHASPHCSELDRKGAIVLDVAGAKERGYWLTCRCWHPAGYVYGPSLPDERERRIIATRIAEVFRGEAERPYGGNVNDYLDH